VAPSAPPLDEFDDPLLDGVLPLDEPELDEPSSGTPPESAAAPSSAGKSPMPRSEPHPDTR
jgi:hypothetical protein